MLMGLAAIAVGVKFIVDGLATRGMGPEWEARVRALSVHEVGASPEDVEKLINNQRRVTTFSRWFGVFIGALVAILGILLICSSNQ